MILIVLNNSILIAVDL